VAKVTDQADFHGEGRATDGTWAQVTRKEI